MPTKRDTTQTSQAKKRERILNMCMNLIKRHKLSKIFSCVNDCRVSSCCCPFRSTKKKEKRIFLFVSAKVS